MHLVYNDNKFTQPNDVRTNTNTKKKQIKHYFTNYPYIHCFIFIDTFPNQKNAEAELLMRIQLYCKEYNIDFIRIDPNGFVSLGHPLRSVSIQDIPVHDFVTVISLHYYSKKISKHKTLLTSWNPVPFLLPYIPNVYSYDGYLSAHSPIIDNFMQSITIYDKNVGYLCTSLPNCLLLPIEPLPESKTVFYIGSNWQNISNQTKNIRHNATALIKTLDKENITSIYGPRKYMNMVPWAGYKTYKGELPFDGKSVITKIKECGICLVLSTVSHIRNEVCSMRIFEGIAAGVPIICDDNPFFRTWFGDNVWYVQGDTIQEQFESIQTHVTYFHTHEDDVITKVKKCREIFIRHFSFDVQFQNIINTLREEPVINELKEYDVVLD